LDLDFRDRLIAKNSLSSDLLDTFIEEGYAVMQLIDGKPYIKITTKYFEELGEVMIKYPRELCVEYWNKLVDETRNCGIMEFMAHFCSTHMAIKDITDGQVDFCKEIGEEIG
jgi:hypothetical protein